MGFKDFLQEDTQVCGTCSQCGECCRYVTMIFTNEDMEKQDKMILESRGRVRTLDDKRQAWDILSVCEHLGPTGKCLVYEDRPQFCRDHPCHPDELLPECTLRIRNKPLWEELQYDLD